jgi:hypothetical protein
MCAFTAIMQMTKLVDMKNYLHLVHLTAHTFVYGVNF